MLSNKVSDTILNLTQELYTLLKNDPSDINEKINALCFSIEYFAAFCATTAREVAKDLDEEEAQNITLDFMLEAVLDKRAAEYGTQVSGEESGHGA